MSAAKAKPTKAAKPGKKARDASADSGAGAAPSSPSVAVDPTVTMIPATKVVPSPLNRHLDDDPGLTSLADSIKEFGLQQPIAVRPHPDADGEYEIISGERRWRACLINNQPLIPCIVWDVDDRTAQAMRLIENVERRDLGHLEEAEAVSALLNLYNDDVSEVAARIGRGESFVRRRARLASLSPAWRAELANPDTEYRNIRDSVERMEDIAILPKPEQDALLTQKTLRWCPDTPTIRRKIREFLHRIDARPWSDEFEKSLAAKSQCEQCAKRSDRQGDLFATLTIQERKEEGIVDPTAMCLDSTCWSWKTSAYLKDALIRAKRQASKRGCEACLVAAGYLYPAAAAAIKEIESLCGETVNQRDWERAASIPDDKSKNYEDAIVLVVPVNGEGLGEIIEARFEREEEEDEEDAEKWKAEQKAEREKRELDNRKREAFIQAIRPHLETCSRPDEFEMLRLILCYDVPNEMQNDNLHEIPDGKKNDLLDPLWQKLRVSIGNDYAYENSTDEGRKELCATLEIDWEKVRAAMDSILADSGEQEKGE